MILSAAVDRRQRCSIVAQEQESSSLPLSTPNLAQLLSKIIYIFNIKATIGGEEADKLGGDIFFGG